MQTVEKEMEVYEIRTFADIVRALKAHPDWLDELRRLILTSELLELPRKFEKFIEEDFKPLKAKVDRIEQDVAVLKQDVAVLKQDVAVLKQDVVWLKRDMGRLKGSDLERRVKERAPAYFGRLLRKTKVISLESLAEKVDEAEQKGLISEEERLSVLRVDALISGEIKSTGKPVILTVEVSFAAHETDIERAKRRAGILSRLFEQEVIAVVAATEAKKEVKELAESLGVLFIEIDYDIMI